MPEREQQRLLRAALEREAEAQELLLSGDRDAASAAYREVSELYRRSWEAAHARAFGRLVGYLKAALLAGDGEAEAAYVRAQLSEGADSPTSGYAIAIAALVTGEDDLAVSGAAAMREDSPAFGRAADAIEAIARADGSAFQDALEGIVADFEARAEHLTGVAFADTALVLSRLAAKRGIATEVRSPLLPAS